MNSVLVLNCGSSSIKFAVIDANDKTTLLSGVADRLGQAAGEITFKTAEHKSTVMLNKANHEKALAVIVEKLSDTLNYHIIAVGHRVVHGGELFSASCLIDETVLQGIVDCNVLAPLHNPANVSGILAAKKAYPHLPQVAVFDTAFHQSLPEKNFLYAIPYDYYRQHGVRRYGFHGTSYRYIKRAIPRYHNGVLPEKVIVAHLGNGASVCAMHNGQSVATSMGLTPLDGLVQGTRSGAIDPAIVSFLAEKFEKSDAEMTNELWKQSGLLGLSMSTNDCRELESQAQRGESNSQRALDVFVTRLQETIGGYAALMNGVDALVFTGGIGENSVYIRQQTVANLSYLGFVLDAEKNAAMIRGGEGDIAADSQRPVWVIPTNEELMICEDTLALISEK